MHIRPKKQIAIFLLCIIMLIAVYGCNNEGAKEPSLQETDMTPEPTPYVPLNVSETLVGFVVPNTDTHSLNSAKHGFLRTAETMYYPAKLYYASPGSEAVAAVEQAAAEGCKGLLIWCEENNNASAIARANELNLPVVVPYNEADCPGVSANVVADINGYYEEVALRLAERMVERECKAGKILVYGTSPQTAYAGFEQAISTYYPQYNVSSFQRTGATQEAAVEELSRHILWNRDIKGIFSTDTDGSLIAVLARQKATTTFRANGAPELQTPAPGETVISYADTPGPTPVPEGLIKSITISVAGYGLNDDTVRLMRQNDIQAFIVEPYYEAAAQSLLTLDRIINGESVPEKSTLNMPIVRTDTLDKYVLIDQQVRDWFATS
ncbi:substrate-binding domain-containing protein [Christensenellaceae bacterium OttesenSCG-928-L17]|nr:substrate-binding domain-containing protein [Christensenellaceae bacterium OttesenSCG-928-L17]